jgi:tRNA(Glu) U13 pseudouridine synthase TruD
MSKQRAINPKYYPTKTLKFFRENNYCGIDGLDREQYKEEIDQEYYRRMTRAMELDSETLDEQWEAWFEMMSNLPPEFPYLWDEATQSYIEF